MPLETSPSSADIDRSKILDGLSSDASAAQIRQRLVEYPQREAKQEDFTALGFGAVSSDGPLSTAALDTLRSFAYDTSYPHRELALNVLSGIDRAAKEELHRISEQRKADNVASRQQMTANHPVIRGCCKDD